MTSAWIWMADADAVAAHELPNLRAWLSAGELARCQRFVREQRLRQFVIGRVLLRMALGRLLGVAPRKVELEDQVGKAPLLVAPALKGTMPGFSIAHSGRWVACAVSAGSALGLDIEMRDPTRDLAALAAQAFDARELARWQALPVAQRVDAFYRLWSEKEARFKLGLPSPRETFNPHAGGPAADPSGTDPGYVVAVAHDELSVVLCSERRLDETPQIELVRLA